MIGTSNRIKLGAKEFPARLSSLITPHPAIKPLPPSNFTPASGNWIDLTLALNFNGAANSKIAISLANGGVVGLWK